MGGIFPITLIPRIIPIPIREAGAGHPLAQAALFQEVLLQPPELLVNQVVGLVNQADGNVGDDLGRAGFHKLAVKLVGLRYSASEPADILRLFGIFRPQKRGGKPKEALTGSNPLNWSVL